MNKNIVRKFYLLPLIVGLALFPSLGSAHADLPEWQARAAEAFDLANEAGLANWQGSLPMLWTESDAVRRVLYLAPRVREDKLEQAYEMLNGIRDKAGADNRVLQLLAAIEAYRGDWSALTDLARENAEGRQDDRFAMLDLALYLRVWETSNRLVGELDAEGVQWAVTYRRAILAGIDNKPLLAASLWREAVAEGLPMTQAAYKEIYKAGLGQQVTPPPLHSKVKGFLDTCDYFRNRSVGTAPSPLLIPDAFRNGLIAYEAGNYREALQYWQNVTSPADIKFNAQCMMGEAKNRLGRFDEAIPLWQEIIKADPGCFLGYWGLAQAYRGKGMGLKAEACLQSGYRRTESAFLLKNNLIGPATLHEIQGTVEKTDIPGRSRITVPGTESQGADGFWISWNYGRDWLWYPNYGIPVLTPAGDEYWLKGTSSKNGSGFPDQMLQGRTFAKPNVLDGLTVTNTGCGQKPNVRWDWDAPVSLRFEYWTSHGARMVVNLPPQTQQNFALENVDPGLEYRYRAYVTLDGQEIALVEGTFTTGAGPFWVGIAKPTYFYGIRTVQAIIPVQSMESAVLTGEFRWAVGDRPWSDWSPVKNRLDLEWPSNYGETAIRLQFRDRQGRISPELHEPIIRPVSTSGGMEPWILLVNSGETAVSERSVLLSLNRTGENFQVRFSNDGVLWGPWDSPAECFHWRLSAGDGSKTVLAQIRQGDRIQTVRTSIELDTQLPVVSDLKIQIGPDRQAIVSWRTSEPTRSRIYWGRDQDDQHLVEEQEYSTEHRVMMGRVGEARIIWRLEAEDRAGNLAVLTDGWITGETAVEFARNTDIQVTPVQNSSQNVLLRFSTSGASPSEMRLRNRGGAWTAWQPFQTSLRWSLLPLFEEQTVEAQLRMADGTVSPVYSIESRQDLRPPRVYDAQVQAGLDGIEVGWKTDKTASTWALIQAESEGGFRDYASILGGDPGLSGTIVLGKLPQGKYRIRVMADDSAGNWNASAWVAYEVN